MRVTRIAGWLAVGLAIVRPALATETVPAAGDAARSAARAAGGAEVAAPAAAGATVPARRLENGVLLVHAPPAIEFSSHAPKAGWCQAYEAAGAITACADQVTRVDREGGVVWYVIAAWAEEKEWCGTGFGLGQYDSDIFSFVEATPCFPVDGLTMPTTDWPGPGEGVMFAITDGNTWKGRFVPVFCFTGYAYGEGRIPLSVEPRTQTAGTADCGPGPSQTYDALALGALGLFTSGIEVCPPQVPGPAARGAGSDGARAD